MSRPTSYRWLSSYEHFGLSGLEDRRCGPSRVWNRIPHGVRQQVIELALERPELSSRELAVTFTDEQGYFISEASVYRLLKAQDLIGTPVFRVMRAADEFRDKTTARSRRRASAAGRGGEYRHSA